MSSGDPHPSFWRSPSANPSPAELQFLVEASKGLLGYRVHLAFKQFLDVLAANFNRWQAHGLIRNLLESAPLHSVAFDFGALDLEYLTRMLGVYLYIYSSHKGANERLMRRFDGKQVLYLRGYEFAVTLNLGAGQAAEASSVETLRFNETVKQLIAPGLCLFKVLSPEETYWGTEALAGCFRLPDLDAVAQNAMHPFRSVFLDALHWQQGILALLDRMDHFLVYVSSVTPSAMWELLQLDAEQHRGRVTVVFDSKAIAAKGAILDYQKAMLDQGGQFIWPKTTAAPTLTPDELRGRLAERFHVVELSEFMAHLEEYRDRLTSTSSPLPPGERETSLPFNFYPAVDTGLLVTLRDYSSFLKTRLETAIARQDIACGLLFLNDIQLRIYTTLLLGEHDETGLALATYTGLLRAVLTAYQRTSELPIWQSPLSKEKNIGLLEEHIQVARDWGVSLMSCGPTDQFQSIYAQAKSTFLEREASAAAAVDKLLHRWPIEGASAKEG